jgi:hypothetical protein
MSVARVSQSAFEIALSSIPVLRGNSVPTDFVGFLGFWAPFFRHEDFACDHGCTVFQSGHLRVVHSGRTRPSSAAWTTCAGSLRFDDEARHATGRSRNLASFSGAFLPYRLESDSSPGDCRRCLPSPYKNQGLPRCARKNSKCRS